MINLDFESITQLNMLINQKPELVTNELIDKIFQIAGKLYLY
jgi:hypothetical protein